MKQALLTRAWEDHRATLGMLTVSGVAHNPFFTLENPLRETKVDSRIPEGTYYCEPYSGTKFQGVYKIFDVPDREDILFHWGNKEKDTLGCILIGESIICDVDGPMVGRSRDAFRRFKSIMGEQSFRVTILDVPIGVVMTTREGWT